MTRLRLPSPSWIVAMLFTLIVTRPVPRSASAQPPSPPTDASSDRTDNDEESANNNEGPTEDENRAPEDQEDRNASPEFGDQGEPANDNAPADDAPADDAPADDAPADEDAVATPPIVPPSVAEEHTPTWPVALLGEEAAEILLRITLNAEGHVDGVEVTQGLDPNLDAIALDTVAQSRFAPATRDGVPFAVRFMYRVVVPAAPPPEPTHGELGGVVLDGQEQPVAGATVRVTRVLPAGESPEQTASENVDQAPLTLLTDTEGHFDITPLAPGTYEVQVEQAQSGSEDAPANANETPRAFLLVQEEVHAGERTEVTYRLRTETAEEDGDPLEFGAEAVVEAPPREVVRRTMPAEHMMQVAGTRGDPLRAVEILPGVGRPSFGVGELIVRGAGPDDSEIFIEGATAPLLYHFGGLTSVVQGSLLERIDFYPGNFSSRYGRRTGGILDVSFRDPATDGFHTRAEFSVIDTSLLLEGPLTDTVSVAVAARRSLLDIVINRLDSDDIGIVAAPVYYDYQLLGSWRPNSRHRLRWFVYGSSDRFSLNQSDPSDDDPAIAGNFGLTQRFTNLQLIFDAQVTDRLRQETVIAYAPIRNSFGVGEFSLDAYLHQIQMRSEWRLQASDNFRVTMGADIQTTPFNITGTFPDFGAEEGGGEDVEGGAIVSVDQRRVMFRPALYLELDWTPNDHLQLIAGLRGDYYSEIRQGTLDPRLTGIVSFNDSVRWKFGAGLYSQPPGLAESIPQFGNPNLDAMRSVHLGTGFEWDFYRGMNVGVEGFYKHLWNRPTSTIGGVEPRFENTGIGRIYGMEFALRVAPPDLPFFGYLSYTLSRSERRDRPGESWRLFDSDQTHILSAAFTYRLPRGWSVGTTFRYVSGNPSTPVVGSIYDAGNGIYQPVNGAINSGRDSAFHRLDLRIEKQWEFETWKLAFFIDLQNVYNRRNQEGLSYSYDFTESAVTGGLPIIPSIGLRGEL